MADALLKIAYRVAPEPLAERISQKIWQRDMKRRWEARVSAHVAAGGKHVVTAASGIVHEHLA